MLRCNTLHGLFKVTVIENQRWLSTASRKFVLNLKYDINQLPVFDKLVTLCRLFLKIENRYLKPGFAEV